MKKFIAICVLVIAAITVHAQAGYQKFSTDTLKGAVNDTLTFGKRVADNGFITFDITLDGFGTDSATAVLEGSNDNFVAHKITVSTQAYKSATATTYQLSDNPAKYLYYRTVLKGKATDTVRYTNGLFIFKK